MNFEQEFASLKQRIAKAERACDRWRAAGQQELYLQARSTVSALDVQLHALRETRQSAENRLPGPNAGS